MQPALTMWIVPTAAMLLCGGCTANSPRLPDAAGPLAEQLSRVPVRPIVGVVGPANESSRTGIGGNAVELGNGWLLTAGHVIPGERVVTGEGERTVADLTRGKMPGRDSRFEGDWAVFRVDHARVTPTVRIGPEAAAGEVVYIVGMHAGGKLGSWDDHLSLTSPTHITARVCGHPWWSSSRGDDLFWMTGPNPATDFGSLSGGAIVRVAPTGGVELVGIYVGREALAAPIAGETVWVGHRLPDAAQRVAGTRSETEVSP